MVSGINKGPNLGDDIIYSGTVSAAIEGALLTVPSLPYRWLPFVISIFGAAAEFTAFLVSSIHETGGIPPETLAERERAAAAEMRAQRLALNPDGQASLQ